MISLALIAAWPGEAKVARTTLEKLFTASDRVVIGEVLEIERVAGFKWAKTEVRRDIKGGGSSEILFLAEPTWTCDTSSAQVGEQVLLFLVEAANPDTSWHFKSPNRAKLPRNSYLIAWSGRGHMPLRLVNGEQFATIWDDVVVPDEVAATAGPAEYSFIRSYRLQDLLEVLTRPARRPGA